MSEVYDKNLKAIGVILHRKNEEIRRLQEENARLRGQLTDAQRKQNREDEMVFRLIREKPAMSTGCLRVVVKV